MVAPESVKSPSSAADSRARTRSWTRGSLVSVLTVVFVLLAFRSAIADWNDVPTGSMRPTIVEGDRILVDKLAYDLRLPFTSVRLVEWQGPQRADVIVFFGPDDTRMVKRVIGMPGDTVAMRRNRLFINDRQADYRSAGQGDGQRAVVAWVETLDGHSHLIHEHPGLSAQRSFDPVAIPAGHYFVMGDNRDVSLDSRWFGPIPREQIVGRATRVALSVDPERHYRPRFDRTLRPLD